MIRSTKINPPAIGTAITAALNHNSFEEVNSCTLVMRFLLLSCWYLFPCPAKGKDAKLISVSTTGLYTSKSLQHHSGKFKEPQLHTLQYLQKMFLYRKKKLVSKAAITWNFLP